MRGVYVTALLTLWFGAEVHATPQWCEVLVSPEKVTRDDTDGFIAYLGQLLENQVIGIAELSKLKGGLERGILMNPLSDGSAHLDSRLMVHHEGLQERIDDSSIDPARLLDWAKRELRERSRVRVHRDGTEAETQDPHQRMEFHRIEPGSFQMGDHPLVPVTFFDPFDLMSTPVTQKHWSQVMGENPSHFKEGSFSLVMMIHGNAVKMQPNHPVESVSWDQVQEFIKKLNQMSAEGDPLLARLIPDYRKGDQFRLPMEAEWEFVAKNRGRSNGRYFFGEDPSDLGKYAWNKENSEESTHPVAQLDPLVIDGQAFYDLYGNVSEWTQDVNASIYRVFKGGCWAHDSVVCRSTSKYAYSHKAGSNGIGFRLVRVSRPVLEVIHD